MLGYADMKTSANPTYALWVKSAGVGRKSRRFFAGAFRRMPQIWRKAR